MDCGFNENPLLGVCPIRGGDGATPVHGDGWGEKCLRALPGLARLQKVRVKPCCHPQGENSEQRRGTCAGDGDGGGMFCRHLDQPVWLEQMK